MPKKQQVCHYCLRLVPYEVVVDEVIYQARIFILTHKHDNGSLGKVSKACSYCYYKIKPFFWRNKYATSFADLFLLAKNFPAPSIMPFTTAKHVVFGGWTLSSKDMLKHFGVQLPIEVEATFGIDFQQKSPTV